MTKYKYTYERQIKIDRRFYTQEIEHTGTRTERELEQATAPETMRFFRRGLGSRQKIRRRYTKDGREIVYLYSYSPVNENERHLIKYEEMREEAQQ